ncbi:MAG TPA: tRNA (guanosine(37)-N1)-methyltransferase TrmD [bacterium]|jgi:tRNA (guanine37-N1)-methyltransferase|nr:tRNA (guanosine(37)-N1)-methyltransferase TrmD [bacterium]HNT65539.1 tRNA (guanosine(37)-N1)-methyltransferase TrmD [bacterium]
MDIHVISAFPQILAGALGESMLKRAQDRQIARIFLHDLRAFGIGKHKQIDDYSYGGGAGMILKPEPIFACVESVRKQHQVDCALTYLTPAGKVFKQKDAVELSFRKQLFFLCGHYKGVDQRVLDQLVGEELSIGDYVLTGGEIAALAVVDAVVRLLPGVLNDIDSADTDSFQTGLLDHPHYTRPEVFRGVGVPEVLLSGDHQAVQHWRDEKSIEITRQKRTDLYEKYIEL